MVVLKKGSFSLDFAVLKLSGELSEEDRQCAWELYTELSTRVAVTGKQRDPDCRNFDGEVYIESLASFYAFFQEARRIMRSFPVGRISKNKKAHLGVFINDLMQNVLRSFLEKWQGDFRYWWEYRSNKQLYPFDRQREYPKLKEFLSDWSDARYVLRQLQQELVTLYQLVDTTEKRSSK
ncbi:hypothetical protein HKBW3S03_01359 [Candidatus Hakubella thermalkaliphila]|uniref:Uncharacterized protein n=1 Tax=Candidatus Hakubella thermalkaliphila TaxID=2754717 RepID=A0A6V8PXU5_9ACTN|nr:hypothetical protein [Candidatus Hakubella thermalkaliphila]MBT9167175.1 hypothetical protein [Bacillota bacterium]GFP19855.1 hypothetical protein HKBW3S03_01359 [Candidatus Hakubella thermalkaliphila]GFP23413.1 hypothetical protein HKBW3S09_00880 [Candidatus Hakubella thermalkaliphila]GFP30012.1 hypothetical protein HKBW3S34_00932 [Candidatus Hakubella thermalkaliphila]GFP37117.1 hypothetical protein HKBW3S44_00797 [Candidatus Hakubella thermalkaliphila]